MARPKGLYADYDDTVLEVLQEGPETAYQIGRRVGIGRDAARTVLARLKSRGLVSWRQDSCKAELKREPATKDPSPFPKPWWPTPNVGLFG